MKNGTTCEAVSKVNFCRAKREKIIVPKLRETRQINVRPVN